MDHHLRRRTTSHELTAMGNLKAWSMSPVRRRWMIIGVTISFFSFFVWSSLAYNAKRGSERWRSTLWADASGYYIYLPAFFHYGFQGSTVPDTLAEYAGHGFSLDSRGDRILTKYTYGTAVLQAPFYLFVEVVNGFGATSPWSQAHHRAVEVAGIFYWTTGLLLLGLALHRRWGGSWLSVGLVVICAAFGTNTFYYAFRAPGYSHVYSFFLVALALFIIWGARDQRSNSLRLWSFAFACGLISMVRVFDVLMVVALCILLVMEHPALLRSWRTYVVIPVVMTVCAVPQMIYWSIVHGRALYYSYGEEGFANAAHPRIMEVLMAPKNGLMTHAPVLFLAPFGLIAMLIHRRKFAVWLLVFISLCLYGLASWHSWEFGCGYGLRPFVQYVPLACVPLMILFNQLERRAPRALDMLFPIVVICCFINYRAMLQYDICYNADAWDWSPFYKNLVEAFFGSSMFR